MKKILLVSILFMTWHQVFSQKENLGSKINTLNSEFAPVISPDGKILYYSRLTKNGDSDIWYVKMDQYNNWSEKTMMGPELNNTAYNAVCGVTADNNLLFLFGDYTRNGNFFSTSARTKTGWSEPLPVNFETSLNKEKGTSLYGSISSNGKVIIMELNKYEGYGSGDLYVSFKNENNVWSTPVNLGPEINANSWEMTPCIAPDMKTLYFSSDRPGGFGEPDVYMSRRLDDTWLRWSTPLNMGAEVNTKGWDYYYFVPASGEYAYYSSVAGGQNENTDIFRVKLPENLKPKPTILIKGKVLNIENNNPLSATITYESLSKKGTSNVLTSDPGDGSYSIVLPQGEQYGFYASLDGYFPISENINLKDLKKYNELEKNLYLVPIKAGASLSLNNLFFDTGKALIRNQSYSELERLVDMLMKNPNIEIEIAGHTDNVGEDAANQKLSEERAKVVRKFLIVNKIDENRIKAIGYGESKPIATNETDEGRKVNRRVEIKILK